MIDIVILYYNQAFANFGEIHVVDSVHVYLSTTVYIHQGARLQHLQKQQDVREVYQTMDLPAHNRLSQTVPDMMYTLKDTVNMMQYLGKTLMVVKFKRLKVRLDDFKMVFNCLLRAES